MAISITNGKLALPRAGLTIPQNGTVPGGENFFFQARTYIMLKHKTNFSGKPFTYIWQESVEKVPKASNLCA